MRRCVRSRHQAHVNRDQSLPNSDRLFVALRHRNFRLLWIGLLISFSGSLMQTAAILWHVSLLVPDDRRALALGMVGLVRVVPVVFFSLLSGVAADVFDRRRLMLITQTVMAILAAILAALTWHGLDVGVAGLPRSRRPAPRPGPSTFQPVRRWCPTSSRASTSPTR